MSHLKPFGKRVLVKKERLDLGGLKGTPTQEEGMSNTGTITAIGRVGFLNYLRGIKVGTKIRFKKYFIADEGVDSAVFVEVDSIIRIEREEALKADTIPLTIKPISEVKKNEILEAINVKHK